MRQVNLAHVCYDQKVWKGKYLEKFNYKRAGLTEEWKQIRKARLVSLVEHAFGNAYNICRSKRGNEKTR